MQLTVSESRQNVKWIKRCFVLLWNCVSRPFSLAFNGRGCQCGKQRRKVEVGSALVAAGSWLPAFPKGCTSPALCRQHKPRQQIPLEGAGFHSAISPGLTEASHKAFKKKKREQPKEKAPKPMTLMIYRSWQCYSCHCQAWEFIFAWCYCPSPHVVNNSLTPFKHTPHPFQPPYPSMAQTLFILKGF